MKKTVSVNSLQVEIKTVEVKKAVEDFNALFQSLKDLQLGIQIKNEKEISAMLYSPEEWIKNRLIAGMEPQTVKVFGITLKTKPAKLLDMVEMPDFTKLKETCKKCLPQTSLLKYLEITPKGITLGNDAIELIVKENSLFASSSQAVAASEALETILQGINQWNAIAKANEVGCINQHNLNMVVDLHTGEAKMNEQWLLRSGFFNR